MARPWQTFRLLAPTLILLVTLVLLNGWLCYRVGLGVARGELGRVPLVIELLAASTAVVVVIAWLAVRLRTQWIAPIQSITDAVDQMAEGKLDARAPLSDSAGPVHDLAHRFNAFVEQVQSQISELLGRKADLTSVIDSLPDPILLADSQQRVILINQPAARFLSLTTEQALGKKLVSILGEASLVDVYESLARETDGAPHTLVREIHVMRDGHKQTYQSVASRTSAGGMLLVLRDVSRLAATVQMKTDFVANASHELRTPIAAIKLAFETLSDVYADDPEQTARCIRILGGHMQRLEAMLQDLLDLSRVENAELRPDFIEFSAADVLAPTRSAMSPLARDKKIDLVFDIDDAMVFRTDRKLFDLIAKNLIENAVKYTPEGGRVNVTMQRRDTGGQRAVVFTVADTGIGIPPQHLDRVFERFYQVDSARSGSAGRGTGLGLAIVKHAAAALGAQIGIDSIVGRGTIVTCTLPE